MAASVSPNNRTGGQQLDIALMVADGGPNGKADPAFDAHTLPIGEWARAVWEERLPRPAPIIHGSCGSGEAAACEVQTYMGYRLRPGSGYGGHVCPNPVDGV